MHLMNGLPLESMPNHEGRSRRMELMEREKLEAEKQEVENMREFEERKKKWSQQKLDLL